METFRISGIGNSLTRQNEITADDLAILRNYIFNWEYGVLNRSGWNFNAHIDGNNVVVEKGIMFAYGYFGIFPETYTIPFIKPSSTQYRFIYAEIDRSVVPNTCMLKVKNNQGSDKIKPTTFRQDYLTAIRTGVFQLPLWRVELNNEGIVKIVSVRDLRNAIGKVKHSDNTTTRVTKEISPNAIATTQPTNDRSKKLATTEFVHLAAMKYIDDVGGNPYKARVEIQVTNGTTDVKTMYFSDTTTKKLFTINPNTGYKIYQYNISVDSNLELLIETTGTYDEKTFSLRLKELPSEYTIYIVKAQCV